MMKSFLVSLLCLSASIADASDCTRTGVNHVSLDDLGPGLYLGQFQGGLYPGGVNVMPPAHAAAGLQAASLVQPLSSTGTPNPSGKIVLLSVGMSNTSFEFCADTTLTHCSSWGFVGQAAASPLVNHATLAIANGAQVGAVNALWSAPDSITYDHVRDNVLVPAGLTEAQVQVVWLKAADANPTVSLPNPNADAYTLFAGMAGTCRALKIRYPNIRQVFVSSRVYGGYSNTNSTLNPEPYAFECGLACKWLVEAQINQLAGGNPNPIAGDLSLAAAPWIAWGPYLWANGTHPRSDGLIWVCSDFNVNDGIHPAAGGQQKVATKLMDFFLHSPQAQPWFRADGGGPCVADINQDGGVDGGDVQTFFELWAAGETGADVNRDGGVDGTDVGVFFEAWEAGGC